LHIPTTRRDTVIEDYHGTPVADPYRWLEDATSAEEQAWGEAQYALTQAYLKEGLAYPPTLIMTADTDGRVVPAHTKKFTATLQAAYAGNNPILLRLEMKAGHGMGKPTSKIIEARSDMLAFLFKVFGMA
jgi:prolyl oligopeptidase